MPENNKCPSCGATLPADLPAGLCAACLLAVGLPATEPAPGAAARRSTIRLSPPPLAEKPGDRIGRYKLLQQIGEGGCGVVYMAEQEEPVKRRVALKVIKPGMDTKEVLGRFEAERQALALMDHSNIAKVLDAGATETGRPFFVMELVRGIPITRYCDENTLNTEQRLKLFIQVCQAIQHAHQKGIIHRDIKPTNILVADHDGVPVPKIIDFGIAKATAGQTLTDKTVFTAFEQFIGTPAYMSPEQAKVSGLDIDTRSDIYSLGVLLYELLTGKTPFDGKKLLEAGFDEIRRIIREEEPPRPSQKLSTLGAGEQTTTAKFRRTDSPRLIHLVRGDLDWIVMKCLEKDRNRRYETANGLARDIQRHLSNEPVVARPPSNLYRLQKMVRRNKLVFTACVAIAAALLLGIIAATWQSVRATHAKREALTAQAQAVEAQANEVKLRRQAETEELTARQRAYAADMNLIQQALKANNLGRARSLLERQRSGPGQKDLRGWEWRYLWQRCRGDALFKLGQETNFIIYAGYIADGTQVVTFDSRGRILIWDVATRSKLVTLQDHDSGGPGPNSGRVAISADGELLAAPGIGPDGNGASVKIWRVSSGEMLMQFPCDHGAPVSVAFSPDKSKLAVYIPGREILGEILVWDLATRTLLYRLSAETRNHPLFNGAVKFSPDGRLLAIGPARGPVRLVEAATGRETATLDTEPNDGVMTLDFSPDGRMLAAGFGTDDMVIEVWDVAARIPMHTLIGHTGYVTSVAFSPDGKTLASTSADATIKLWNVATGLEEATLLGHNDEVWSVKFSPNGASLLTAGKDGAIYVWSSQPTLANRGYRTLPLSCPPGIYLMWPRINWWDVTPDNSTLAAINEDGSVSLWDISSLCKTTTLGVLGTNISTVCWISDGQLLAGSSTSAEIRIWDPRSGTVNTYPWNTAGKPVVATFLPKTGALVTWQRADSQSNWIFRVWDTLSRKEISSFHVEKGVRDVVVSPDEKSLGIATYSSPGTVLIYNLTEGTVQDLGSLQQDPVQGVAFVPASRLLATAATEAPVIKLWDLDTHREVVALRGFNLVIGKIVSAPDGKRLAAVSLGFEPIKIWDTASWEEVASLEVPGQPQWLMLEGFFPDGNTLAASDHNAVLHLWHAPSWAEINLVESNEEAEIKQP